MTGTLCSPRQASSLEDYRSRQEACFASPPERAKRNGWPVWSVLCGLLLSLLFAHGCHGDEDTELFDLANEKAAEATPAAR